MRNIYILDEYITSAKNGIGTFLKAYMKCLKKIEANICLIVFNADCDEFSISFRDGIKFISFPRFPWGNFTNHPGIVNKFFRLYIEDSPDNVFCFNHSPCDELLLKVHQSHPLSKLIFIIHNQLWTGVFKGDEAMFRKAVLRKERPEIQKQYPRLTLIYEMEQRMYEVADAVVALSPGTYRLLLDIYKVKKDKIWLIPNGLPGKSYCNISRRNELRNQFSIKEDESIILFVGRVSELKGGRALCEAFDYVLEEYPQSRLIIVGPIVEQFSSYSSGRCFSKIIYTGLLESKELKKWYQMADIGVIPSYTEQCSYVGIEMMMYGLPIVASDGFGLCDMFADRMNALVAPIGDRKKGERGFSCHLAFAIKELLSSEKLREELRENARETYRKRYNLYRMQERYERLFDHLQLFC